MEWLVYQSVLIDEDGTFEGNTYNNKVQIAIYIRKVVAENQEEAIGKFILDTSKETFKRRIEPLSCFELAKLKTI